MIFTEAIRKSFLPFNFALLLSVGKIQFSSDDKKTDKIMISRKNFFFTFKGLNYGNSRNCHILALFLGLKN